jgi:RNA polymerase sigma factor (sigma-70 family)
MAVHPKARQFLDGIHGQGQNPLDLEGFLAEHGNALLATARRHSLNAADAEDAYQRALEILLTKAPDGLFGEQLAAWTHTVVRNEALQAHRRKKHEVETPFDVISESWVADSAQPDEKLLDSEQLGRGREALKRLNPDQTRCMLLRADGMNYEEICEITGFTYTKVNRLLSDGRRAFRNEVVSIETGATCRRIQPMLSAFADGEIGVEGRNDVDSHLAGCLVCRSSLREIGEADRLLSSLFPVGVAAAATQGGVFARAVDNLQSSFAGLQERIFGHAATAQSGAEVITAKKIAAAAAIVAALAGGGVAADRAIHNHGSEAPVRAKPAAGSAQPTQLFDGIQARRSASARARARRRAARSARAADATTAAKLRSSRTPGEQSADNTPALSPAQQVAPDPADVAPAGGETVDSGSSGNLAP